MEKKLFLPLLLGTNREGRQSELAAQFVLKKTKERESIETELIDVRDFTFPKDNYGDASYGNLAGWQKTMARADGLIIVTPEYNHGYPGVLKSLLDVALKEYRHKVLSIVGVSARPWGASVAIEQLAGVAKELGFVITKRALQFPEAQDLFNEQGSVKDKAYEEHVKNFLDEMEWMATALKWGRENLASNE
ncbi:MAG: NAD(P)H-dependent oxidoreductase [bacterium]|nr:NAD(P)H-dependent oxidoreductase [bacterium]